MNTFDAARWPGSRPFSQRALNWVARLWFTVVVAGQLAFAAYIVLFYTLSAIHGQLGDRAKFDNHGYVAGDTAGNLAAVSHIFFAFLISLSAALQLVPQVRQRAPSVHRWNGRLLILGAFVVSLAGIPSVRLVILRRSSRPIFWRSRLSARTVQLICRGAGDFYHT